MRFVHRDLAGNKFVSGFCCCLLKHSVGGQNILDVMKFALHNMQRPCSRVSLAAAAAEPVCCTHGTMLLDA